MFPRPTAGDTEEDLLKLQQEFLASQTKSAAQVIRPGGKRKSPLKADNQGEPPEVPCATKVARDVVSMGELPQEFSHKTPSTSVSASQAASAASQEKRVRFDEQEQMADDPEDEINKHDTHITKVLSDIVERDLRSLPVYYPSQQIEGGFPKVLHRGDIEQLEQQSTGGKKQKKKSLFAQQFASRQAQDFGLPVDFKKTPRPTNVKSAPHKDPVAATVRERPITTATSDVITGDGLDPQAGTSAVSEIHDENSAKMAAMSEGEILAEQRNLLELLDPSIVSFLKKKSKAPQDPSKIEKSPEVARTDVAMETSEPPKSSVDHKAAVAMDTTDLPVPTDQRWVHMDKVEGDKLAWLKDVPAPTAGDTTTGKPARFDFEGNLVATEADVPTHLGLHHHGNEPERAGYSLEELFLLARSANMQQRVLALNTLARVIDNARRGVFHERVSAPLIPALVSGGLVFILRWALDDATDNTMVAAVGCLHALLVNRDDELCLDAVFCWYRGHHIPCLCPAPPSDSGEQTGDQQTGDDQPTDAEILKHDLIKGLHTMSLLPRLRYVLEVWRPPPLVVVQILEILTRFARHSPEMCYQITLCPRLIDTIFNEFLPYRLPDTWPAPLTTAYGFPCSWALKLIRVVCGAGRHMAASLISHCPLMDRIVVYISQGQEKGAPRHEEAHRVQLEVFRIWRTLVGYELALTHFSEYYSLLVRLLQDQCTLGAEPSTPDQTITCTSTKDQTSARTDQTVACTLLAFLETVTHTGANITQRASQRASQQRSQKDHASELRHQEAAAIPEFNWSHVSGLCAPVLVCVQRGLAAFCRDYYTKRYDLSLLSGALNFVASWISRSENMPGYDAVASLESIEQLCDSVVLPVLRSQSFKTALEEFRHTSVLLCPESPRRPETLPSLPEYGALIGPAAIHCPITAQRSPAAFITAFIRLLAAFKAHRGVMEKVYPLLLEESELLLYLRKVLTAGHSLLAHNHFCVTENTVQELLVTMVKNKPTPPPSVALYHQVALLLLTHSPEGAEHTVHGLLSGGVFNVQLLSDLSPSAATLADQLTISPPGGLTSATSRTVTAQTSALMADTLSALSAVRATYLGAFGASANDLQKSCRRCEDSPSVADTFVLGRCGQLLVPVDWVFLPLIEVYNNSGPGARGVEEAVPRATVATVTNCLRWVYLMETGRPQTLKRVSPALKLSRVLCAFLAGSDLFLEAGVQSYLAALLRVYCRPSVLDRLDLSEDIPGLASFYDLYMMLLDQFEAVSFGDSVFASYVLIPLQQAHSVMLRRAVWGERVGVLRAMLIPVNEVCVALSRFLDPPESDVELVCLYYKALYSRSVSPSRSPLMYLLAVHHVNTFCYDRADEKHRRLRRGMLTELIRGADQTLRHHVLYYKSADRDQPLGMTFYDPLPASRQQLIDALSNS